MARIFSLIPGMDQIMVNEDWRKNLLHFSDLPDYRSTKYSVYHESTDALTIAGKVYYNRVPRALGGYDYTVCSHQEVDLSSFGTKYQYFAAEKVITRRNNQWTNGDGTVVGTWAPDADTEYYFLNNYGVMVATTPPSNKDYASWVNGVNGGTLYKKIPIYEMDSDTGVLTVLDISPSGMTVGDYICRVTHDEVFDDIKTYYKRNTGIFAGQYIKLVEGVDYTKHTAIASVGYKVYEQHKHVYIDIDGFVGTEIYGRAEQDKIYERYGDKFPYGGYYALVANGSGVKTRSNIYRCKERGYEITSDPWRKPEKQYYTYDSATKKYVATDDGSDANSEKVFFLNEFPSFIMKTADTTFQEGKQYFRYVPNTNTYRLMSPASEGYAIGGSIRDWLKQWNATYDFRYKTPYVYTDKRTIYYKTSDGKYEAVDPSSGGVRYGITKDTQWNGQADYYFYYTGTDYEFKAIPTDKMYTQTVDKVFGYYAATFRAATYLEGVNYYQIDMSTKMVRQLKRKTSADDVEGDYLVGDTIDANASILVKYGDAGNFPMPTYYYIANVSAPEWNSKFAKFELKDKDNNNIFEGRQIADQSSVIYVLRRTDGKWTGGTIPKEIEICSKFSTSVSSSGTLSTTNATVAFMPQLYLESSNYESMLPDKYYEKCEGIYDWESFYLDHGFSSTPVEEARAYYTSDKLFIKWKDPAIMLKKDEPEAGPDSWAQTRVKLVHEAGVETEIAVSTVQNQYAEEYLTIELTGGTMLSLSRLGSSYIEITAVSFTGTVAVKRIFPKKIEWLMPIPRLVNLFNPDGVPVEGVEYFDVDGETQLYDLLPNWKYKGDGEKWYNGLWKIKYQKNIPIIVRDATTKDIIRIPIIDDDTEGAPKSGDFIKFDRTKNEEYCTVAHSVLTDGYVPTVSIGELIQNGDINGIVGLGDRLTIPYTANATVVDRDSVELIPDIEESYYQYFGDGGSRNEGIFIGQVLFYNDDNYKEEGNYVRFARLPYECNENVLDEENADPIIGKVTTFEKMRGYSYVNLHWRDIYPETSTKYKWYKYPHMSMYGSNMFTGYVTDYTFPVRIYHIDTAPRTSSGVPVLPHVCYYTDGDDGIIPIADSIFSNVTGSDSQDAHAQACEAYHELFNGKTKIYRKKFTTDSSTAEYEEAKDLFKMHSMTLWMESPANTGRVSDGLHQIHSSNDPNDVYSNMTRWIDTDLYSTLYYPGTLPILGVNAEEAWYTKSGYSLTLEVSHGSYYRSMFNKKANNMDLVDEVNSTNGITLINQHPFRIPTASEVHLNWNYVKEATPLEYFRNQNIDNTDGTLTYPSSGDRIAGFRVRYNNDHVAVSYMLCTRRNRTQYRDPWRFVGSDGKLLVATSTSKHYIFPMVTIA